MELSASAGLIAGLQLISHRSFLPQLLVASDHHGALLCQKLIHSLLKFLGPLLKSGQVLPNAIKIFYRGTLRVLVVLLHDFPEFLCQNYLSFSQAIPPTCVQLRNLILSAFPRTMHLPDPFTPDLKLDQLPESSELPQFDQSQLSVLDQGGLKQSMEVFAKDKYTDVFYKVLEDHVHKLKDAGEGSEDLLSAFVLNMGMLAADDDKDINNNAAVLAYMHLLSLLESEGRYIVLSAIADHLRYPNRHTCFFHTVLLHLFNKQPEVVKEQVTRVLLERLIVNRPHPWGLLATFIALIKDPKFWEHEFIRCSPDIERLFDNVSR